MHSWAKLKEIQGVRYCYLTILFRVPSMFIYIMINGFQYIALGLGIYLPHVAISLMHRKFLTKELTQHIKTFYL
ncbi:hypothetical protein ACJX0J_021847, partial [Zea mays]